MTYRLTVGLLWVLLTLGGCTGNTARLETRPELSDFTSGAPVSNIALSRKSASLELSFHAVSATGVFLHLALPDGYALAGARWSTSERLLQLVAPLPDGADIGVVPLDGWQPQPLALTLDLSPAPRTGSIPPTGNANALFDLAVEQGGAGQVRLSWTEVNRGDYDFNGIVNITDLTPLAKYFTETYDNTASEAAQLPVYWVDGDGNGQVGLSDLTIIGQRYGSQVAGYSIRRAGAAVGTVARANAEARAAEQLPPRYTAVVDGSIVDEWSVSPLDGGGVPGTGNTVPPVPVDLKVKFSSAGLTLYDFTGTTTGTGAAGFSRLQMVSVDDILRIIDPIDEPYWAELGTALGATTGNAGFVGLPRGEWLLLQVALAPSVDPATGQPWPFTNPPRCCCLHVPVKLPVGTLASQLTLSASFVKQKTGSYKAFVSSQLQAGSLRLDTYSEVDYAAGLVAIDSDGDGSLGGEMRLADPRLCGLSGQRLQQLADDNIYAAGTRQAAVITGRFDNLAQAEGFLTTNSTQLAVGAGGPAAQGTLVMRLTEQTAINEDVVSSANTLRREIGPADLQPGDQLELSGYVLDGMPSLPPRLWLTRVTRVIDTSKPDKLYAWPSQTSAYPGEQVTITVSTEESANPFFALEGVRVCWNNADYVFDSLNAGAPGGERSAIDGVWTQVGANSLTLPNEVALNHVSLPGGRQGVDFFVLPSNGNEVPHASGELLNFKLSILGDVTLTLQRLDSGGIKRSYYSDASGLEYFWADDFNAAAPMIEITDPGGPGGPG